MSEYLESAKEAAEKAKEVVMSYFNKDKGIKYKADIDVVTKADVEAEKVIVDHLKEKYPDHGFIVEEGDDIESDKYVWIIDPIDGTTSFSHNYPFFCISIALYRKDKSGMEPLVGVVHAPYMKETFYAEKGKGAYLNAEKIIVSARKTLRESIVATGFPYTRVNSDIDNLNYFSKVAKVAEGLRRSGSAALDVCYVAAGRVDGYWELGLKTMDTAAAQLILKEAGGKVTDFSGDPIKEDFSKIVATNGKVHDELLSLLREAEK